MIDRTVPRSLLHRADQEHSTVPTITAVANAAPPTGIAELNQRCGCRQTEAQSLRARIGVARGSIGVEDCGV